MDFRYRELHHGRHGQGLPLVRQHPDTLGRGLAAKAVNA
jgi:hypothetical protein